jgi:hypothetical protein
MADVKWLKKPESHDFPAAATYLALLADTHTINELTEKLRAGSIVHKKAKTSCGRHSWGCSPRTTRTSPRTWPGSRRANRCRRSCWSVAITPPVSRCRSLTATTACA